MSKTTIKANFNWNGDGDLLKRMNLQSGGRVQQVIDKSVIDWNLQYCPWDTGTLAKSPYSATEIGSGKVVYPGPYARYQYYGEVYGPNIPKEIDASGDVIQWASPEKKYPTGRDINYSKDVNPLAGSYWFERMKADHKEDILREAKNAVSGK